MFTVRHDFTRFDRHTHANPANETLVHARVAAADIAEARGWSDHLVDEIDDALVVLLSAHAPGDRLTYTEVHHVDRLGYNVCRTANVLDCLGLLDDGRTDTTDAWLEGRLAGFPANIAVDVRGWANQLRHGGPRVKPRAAVTVRNYLGAIHPALTIWSTRYSHLREVTRDDVREHLSTLTGLRHKRCLVGLRSLFRFSKRTGRIFRDPTTQLRTGNVANTVPMPLTDSVLTRAVGACTTSAHRLALALAAIHAARPIALRRLTLDDIDTADRRIAISGHSRRLDDITATLLDRYLADRRRRWPHTLNRHLFITEQTGHDQRPVSEYWLEQPLRPLGVTLKQISMDRQLEEALNHGPDALHLAAVFGIAERTAMRYADAARRLLSDRLAPDAGA